MSDNFDRGERCGRGRGSQGFRVEVKSSTKLPILGSSVEVASRADCSSTSGIRLHQ